MNAYEQEQMALLQGHLETIERSLKGLVAGLEISVSECDRLREVNAELLVAAIRVRARCQSMRFDTDAAAAMDNLDAAIARAESGE